jgi:hypothetical protein
MRAGQTSTLDRDDGMGHRGFTASRLRWLGAGVLAVLSCTSLLVLAPPWRHGRDARSRPVTVSSPFQNTAPNVAYVGDAVCAKCHEGLSRSYRGHAMGRSAALAGAVDTPGLSEGEGRATFEAHGFEYAVERRDGKVVHSETRKGAAGEVVARIEAEVAYVIGSGRRGRSYLVEHDGFLFQSPISWYSQEGRWDLAPDSRAKSNHFQRAVGPNCLFCHTNRYDAVDGMVGRYSPPIFQGLSIGCERCHGPGELHARSPGAFKAGVDPTIVNPAHLEPPLREAVCQQCHLGGEKRVEPVGRKALDYRPGLPLEEFLTVLVDRRKPERRPEAIGHAEQMLASRCYRQSRGDLGCTSCHDPHSLPSAGERVSYYRGRCLECHGQSSPCSLPEPERLERSAQDSCIDCHMPRSRLTDIAHTAETDHTVPRRPTPPGERPIVAGESEGRDESSIVAFRPPVDSSLAGLLEGRDLGVALMTSAADDPQATARMAGTALPLLDSALRAFPDDVPTLHARAIALSRRNRPREAIEDLERALLLSPNHELSLALEVNLLASANRRDDAAELADRLVALNPWVAEYQVMRARIRAMRREWPEVMKASRAALRLDPTNLPARMALILAATQLGDRALVRSEASAYLQFDAGAAERRIVEAWLRQAR